MIAKGMNFYRLLNTVENFLIMLSILPQMHLKLLQKEPFKKTAKETCNPDGNKIVDKITRIASRSDPGTIMSKSSPETILSKTEDTKFDVPTKKSIEIPVQRYISLEKKTTNF